METFEIREIEVQSTSLTSDVKLEATVYTARELYQPLNGLNLTPMVLSCIENAGSGGRTLPAHAL